jgi:hypothetical protein
VSTIKEIFNTADFCPYNNLYKQLQKHALLVTRQQIQVALFVISYQLLMWSSPDRAGPLVAQLERVHEQIRIKRADAVMLFPVPIVVVVVVEEDLLALPVDVRPVGLCLEVMCLMECLNLLLIRPL